MVRHLLAQRELGTRAVREGRVDLWLAFRDPLARALCQLHHELVEVVLAVFDVGDDLLVVCVVDEHPGVVAVAGDVLDVDVVFDRVDPGIADEVALEQVQQLLDLVLRERLGVVLEDRRLGPDGDPLEFAAGRVGFGPVHPEHPLDLG